MGTGIDQRSGRSCSTGGSDLACQAACWAVPVISTPSHSASSPMLHHGGVTEQSPPGPAPVRAVPRRMRQVCALAAAVVVAAMLYVALTLRSSSTGVVAFGPVDQVAVAGIGLVIGAGLLLLGRSSVEAGAEGIRFRNVVLQHEVPWTAVRAVVFERTSPWASLELRNGDAVALFAIQAVDKGRAADAVEGLRDLLAAARAQEPTPPPLLYPPRE